MSICTEFENLRAFFFFFETCRNILDAQALVLQETFLCFFTLFLYVHYLTMVLCGISE